jgi:divalent anion:Na+ symporter, DASS family
VSSDTETPPDSLAPRRAIPCGIIALAVLSLGAPSGVSAEGWHVAAAFVATIAAFILKPLPMGPTVLAALCALAVGETLRYGLLGTPKADQVLGFKRLLAGFGDSTVWLVVAAFLLASAMLRTGLGRRMALALIARFGRSTLGVAYAVCASELVLGPFVPSNTARGGGLMAPIVDALSRALGSKPELEPGRAGRYLCLVGAHANLITAAMFLTGMAANPLLAKAARDVLEVELSWGLWALGAIAPGLVSLLLLPLVLWRLAPPENADGRGAQALARRELEDMGAWSREQRLLAGVFVALLALWVSKPLHHLGTGLVAWVGVLALIALGVCRWRSIVTDAGAWDALVWLGGLISLANLLREEGVIAWFSGLVEARIASLDQAPAMLLVVLLVTVYHYAMYGFSMLTGHILALAAAFFSIAKGFEAPGLLVAGLFGWFSNLCGCTTHYSTGPVIIYFGLGYVEIGTWFRVGFVMSLLHLVIWLGVGLPWLKLLGWW